MNSIVESSTRKQPASRMRIPFLDDSTLYICRWSPFRIVTSPQNQAGLGLGCGCLTIGVYNSGTTDGPTPQYGISPDSARRATSVAKGRVYRISVSHERAPMFKEREGPGTYFMYSYSGYEQKLDACPEQTWALMPSHRHLTSHLAKLSRDGIGMRRFNEKLGLHRRQTRVPDT